MLEPTRVFVSANETFLCIILIVHVDGDFDECGPFLYCKGWTLYKYSS